MWRPFPNVYAFVQDHYWNVGFLRYYTVEQIPNFILASPVLVSSLYALYQYVKTLRIKAMAAEGVTKGGVYGTRARPHVVVWGLMALIALLVMHVQVATRFLSVCPALYWNVVSEGKRRRGGGVTDEVQRAICVYAVTFSLLGTLMFPTFYPWT